MKVDPEKVIIRKADARGRVAIGSEYAKQDVHVYVLHSEDSKE